MSQASHSASGPHIFSGPVLSFPTCPPSVLLDVSFAMDTPAEAPKRQRDKDTEPAAVVLTCADGNAAMSAAEFNRLLEASPVLRQLIFGGGGMKQEEKINDDVFLRYQVTTGTLSVIRACIHTGGVLPHDLTRRSALEDALADLREAAHRVGGFRSVDTALQAHAEREVETEATAHRAAERPSDDHAAMFQWRSVFQHLHPRADQEQAFDQAFDQLQQDGFEWASQQPTMRPQVVNGAHDYRDVHGYVHHFRRPRTASNE